MKLGLPDLLRTTTFRLALAQTGVFLFLTFALLGFVYVSTAGQLTRDAEDAADLEYAALAKIYAQGGLNALNQEVIERAAAGGESLYVLADRTGRIVSGDLDRLPALPEGAGQRTVFEFEAPGPDNVLAARRARGRMGRLLGGPILLVARDMGEISAIVLKITNAVWLSGLVGLGLSLFAGVFASRQAARRAEALSRTARDVMAGDLSRRAPVLGVRDEFDDLAKDLNAMLARLEQLVHSTRTAGDAIAHDLRTPLSRFRRRLEDALDHPPDAEKDREALRRAADEADALLATFNAILRLARVQAASNWRFERVDVSAIARELCDFYEPAAEEGGVSLVGAIEPGLAAPGDQGLITQALSNLIENAVKYTPAPGRIELRVRRGADKGVLVTVADTGPGVPPEDRGRILERFYRMETARTSPGAGLGLSLVAAVADLHKGGLVLGDGLGGPAGPGLQVSLRLPAAAGV